MTDTPGQTPVEGEVRLRIDGGFAYMPGLARERSVALRELPTDVVDRLGRAATASHFFDRQDGETAAGPDARTYCIGLTIGGQSREARIAEPIADPALAELVALVRTLLR